MKVWQTGGSGDATTIHILGPGDMVGAVAVFRRVPYPATATAVTNCRLLSWPSSWALALMGRHPAIKANALDFVGRRTEELVNRLREMATERVDQRIARTLLRLWKRGNPGRAVPLAMFANVAGSYLWAWTAVGAAVELLFQILPVAFGLRTTIDAGLARVFFSWTLHAIVYFWLMPTYIAYYTIVPRAIGGRLFSDSMGRLSFILFLIVAMPIGVHHLFADPEVGAGFKFLHSVFTALVALPTLLTVFTICASVETAGRLRGGTGVFGWIAALPWGNPMMLAVALSFVMLGFGGAGGLVNMSYQLDSSTHNTQWVTGHFHLIFGGAIVIMYFAIAYDLWPHLTGRALDSLRLMRIQLWTWFVGMVVLTFPWHYVGILGMPRRMAFYDYTDPAIARMASSVLTSVAGGAILVVSGILFLVVLIRGQVAPRAEAGTYRFSVALHQPRTVPVALNSFGLWIGLMVGLTLVNYGFPIARLIALPEAVPAVFIGGG